MRAITFRAKLLLIVGTATLSLVAVITGSALSSAQQARYLADLEGRLVPRLELGPRLEQDFERLNQGMQDAVSAQDAGALDETLTLRNRLLDAIAHAGAELDGATGTSLRWAIQDYYELARNVSARSIAGETGEALVFDMSRMQARRLRAAEALKKATGFDRKELGAAFTSLREANRRADGLRLATGVAGLLVLVTLSFWATRSMLRMIVELSGGFARFATGDFTTKIPVTEDDELGRVAREANQMAANLRRLAEQRTQSDWLATGLHGLSDEIRGELEPAGLAERALCFLARRTHAVLGAFYAARDDGTLELLSEYGSGAEPGAGAGPTMKRTFRLGEGLIGQAASEGELIEVDDPPIGYARVHSALGEGPLRALLVFPLTRLERTVGVIELGFFAPSSNDVRELLLAVREGLVVSLVAAKSRAALRELFERTKTQAEQLAVQEHELLQGNAELRAQREQLRETNEELRAQRSTLTERNAELEEARRSLQQKAEELSRVSSYKSQFLANMSHELRTPLNSMLLLSHLLGENEAGNLSSKQVLHARTIHSAGQDLLRLINQVLDLAKIEAGREEVQLESVELSGVVAYARKVFEPLAQDKGLALRIELMPGLPKHMHTDRQRVERIVTNLLGNAIKFTVQGEVALEICRPPPNLTLPNAQCAEGSALIAFRVTDTGVGIDAAARERIFAPFEQLGSAGGAAHGGTGLGLAISRESARLLGGEISVESVPGKGSTFTCYLPQTSVADGAIEPTRASERVRPRAPLQGENATKAIAASPLLVIEDDALLAEQIADIARAREFDVLWASSGEEGLRLARERQPRGIVLDVKLPDIDGWEVMRRLHDDPQTRSIPVHFLSGTDGAERGLALGAVGYVMKPATHDELSGVVRKLMSDGASARRVLVVDDDVAESEALLALLGGEGVQAERVGTAGEALRLLARQRFGCIIVDLGLPDMDGVFLLEALKNGADGAAPRVMVHTGRLLSQTETQKLEAFAHAVITKNSASNERLLEELRRFLKDLASPSPEPIPENSGVMLAEVDAALLGVKVLVAEDDMRTAYSLSALLGGKGADVLVAETGRETLALLTQHADVRVVLLDMMMPEIDGFEVLRNLRQEGRFQGLPVLALSARETGGEREQCLAAGASEFLSKPVDNVRLLATLRDLLEPRTGDAAHA